MNEGFNMNNRGMSLISVLVAIGLLGIVMIGVMAISQNMVSVVQSADLVSQVQEEVFIAQANLSKQHICTANLRGQAVSEKGVDVDKSRLNFRLTKSPTNLNFSDSYIFSSQDPNNTSNKLNLRNMNLKLYKGSDSVAILSVSFESKNSVLGGASRTREIPLKVSLDANGKVESCVASSTGLDGDDDDNDNGNKFAQGRSCDKDPSGSGGASIKELKKYISDVCDYQRYPVTDGLLLKGADIKACIERHGGAQGSSGLHIKGSDRCKAIAELYTTESADAFAQEDIHLLSRNNFKNPEECKKQRVYSEGNRVARNGGSKEFDPRGYRVKTCVNHLWSSDQGGSGAFSRTNSGGIGDSDSGHSGF